MSTKQMNFFPASFTSIFREIKGERTAKHVPLYDRTLFALVCSLILIGFVIVASASMPEGQRLTGNPFHFIQRHAFYVAGSIMIMVIGLQVPMKVWQKYSGWILLLSILALILVIVAGKTVNGSQRWLALGPINIQVSEIAKLTFFCYLAAYIVRRHTEVTERAKGFYKPLAVFVIIAALILKQPDLGTVVVMFVTTVGMLFLAGAKIRDFFALIIVGVSLVVGLIIFEPYRMARVTSFLDPWQDPFGKGYQLTQSLMAFGRGDWLGQGLGNSIQKLEYLPEAHTDFIFAIWAEETGLIGVFALLILQLVLALRALNIGRKALLAEHYFTGYLAMGIGLWLSFQAAVNTGAASGILPTKGLTLPLVSYGGSSLWVMTLAIVILLRIDHERRLDCVQATHRGAS
ncbi:MAG: cell division protein FtsW [Psychrobium sp.]